MTRKEELQMEIATCDQAIAEIKKEMAPLNARLEDFYHMKKPLVQELGEIEFDENQNNPAWLLIAYGENGKEHHAAYKHLHDMAWQRGLMLNGYYPETNQRAFQVMVNKNTVRKTIDGILSFLPYQKPLKDGYVHYGILEDKTHYYTPVLYLQADSQPDPDSTVARVGHHCHGDKIETYFAGSLRECVEWIAEHHAYSYAT